MPFTKQDQLNVAQARAFFDAFEALPTYERQGKLRVVARGLGIDWAEAFRWAYVLRPASIKAGGNWPYEEDIPEPRSKDSLDNPLREEISHEAEGESFIDIQTAVEAGGDSKTLLKAYETAEALLNSPEVERLGEKALYLEDRDVYVVYLRKNAAPVVMPRTTHEYMLKAYSDWDGFPIRVEEICARVGLTRKEFLQYKNVFGWTRKTLPLTDLSRISTEEAIEELEKSKETAILKKWEKRVSSIDRQDAEKWRSLKHAVLEELESAIAAVPEYEGGRPRVPAIEDAEYNLILPFNDWQVGSFAAESRVRFGRAFDRDIFERMIEDYLYQLEAYVRRNSGARWGRPYITLLGDLLHGMIGETIHGTKLAKHMREFDWEQARIAVEALYRLCDAVVDMFGQATIIPLPGNHEGYIVNILGEALKQRYRSLVTEDGKPAVEVVQHEKRTHHEMIGGSYFTFDHGASPDSNTTGGKIARFGAARDNTIKDMVMLRPDYLVEAKKRRAGVYFVMGDQHHTIDESATGVEVIKLPAIPSGDVYADENGWNSRPAQAVLLVEKDVGLRHMERLYFDNTRIFPNG